jgi:hypothetical protein
MKKTLFLTIFIFLFIFTIKSETNPGDSLLAVHTNTIPLIDGDITDIAWKSAKWYNINYMWLPYGTTIPASDFTGRFKVLWNKTTNLLYFLVEITDDVFVNGYVYANNDGTYYNYDVVEVFVDEDRSGGTHTNDNNAFAYHITGGNSTVEYDAIDIYATGTTNKVNNRNHFPEFKRRFDGTHYYWEFSLMAIKNTFLPTNDPSLFKSTLTVGKKMGLSVAYCDNDGLTESPKTRDNFIGSKYLSSADQNNSYINASLFGSLILADNNTTEISAIKIDNSINIWIDNDRQLNCKMEGSWNLPTMRITDISGITMLERSVNNTSKVDVSAYNHGCYLITVTENNRTTTRKIIL